MIRLTHRRCRAEAEQLSTESDILADDLRAAEHGMDEVVDACKDAEYALTEASIPAVLRDRLTEADRLPDRTAERDEARAQVAALTEQREALLQAAHEARMLARTYALMEGTGTQTESVTGSVLAGVHITHWQGFPSWPCQDTTCEQDVRTLVWHTTAPEQAHLACDCGRIWQAPTGATERAVESGRAYEALGYATRVPQRWSLMKPPTLEAIDRALPTPAQLRDREVVPA